MLVIVLILVSGILLGLSIGRISALIKLNEAVLTLTIYLVLFLIVVLTGVDNLIVKGIDSIGWSAFLLIVVTAACSMIICRGFYNFFSRRSTNCRLFTAGSRK